MRTQYYSRFLGCGLPMTKIRVSKEVVDKLLRVLKIITEGIP